MSVELVAIERVNNPTFDEADPQKRRTIVLLGISLYNNIPRHELVVTNSDNIVKQKQVIIDTLEQEIFMLRQKQNNEHQAKVHSLQSQIEHLTQKEQTFYEERDKYAFEMVNRCMANANQQLEQQNKYIQKMEKMNEMLRKDKRSYANNTEKGKEGEYMIESYIVDHIPTATIENTANVPNCTDFRCVFGDIHILIESKHVANVKKCEVDKFARDVRTNAQSIQGAIFVSVTEGVRIPCKRSFDYDTIDGVPCIYISGFATNKHMLLAALQWLDMYNKNAKGNACSHQLFDILYKGIEEWERHFAMITKLKRSVRTTMDDITMLENTFGNTIANTKAQIESIMYRHATPSDVL